jgi:hypothetical protein
VSEANGKLVVMLPTHTLSYKRHLPLLENYLSLLEELEANVQEVTTKEAMFIASLLRKKPKHLSYRQVEWLEDMRVKYLVVR